MDKSLNIEHQLESPLHRVKQAKFEESTKLKHNHKDETDDKLNPFNNQFKSGFPAKKSDPPVMVTESLSLPLKPSAFNYKGSRRQKLKRNKMGDSKNNKHINTTKPQFKKSLSIQIKKRKLNASVNSKVKDEEGNINNESSLDTLSKDLDKDKEKDKKPESISTIPVFEGLKIKKKKFKGKQERERDNVSKSYSGDVKDFKELKGIKIRKKHLNPRLVNKNP